MGDVVGLMHDFEDVIDEEKAEEEARRMLKGRFSLEDFLSQLRMLQRAGPLKDMLEKLPFAGDMFPAGAQVDGRELKRIEAMITSMTPAERARPDIIDPSRRNRVARGSGTKLEDLTEMLKRFEVMRKLMSQLGQGGGMLSKIPGLGKMLGGDAPGLDPSAMADMGLDAMGNRRAARAQKAGARRKQRRAQRKHKRRGKRR
jgi:signal recognition particle subunit SRP54